MARNRSIVERHGAIGPSGGIECSGALKKSNRISRRQLRPKRLHQSDKLPLIVLVNRGPQFGVSLLPIGVRLTHVRTVPSRPDTLLLPTYNKLSVVLPVILRGI